MRRAIIIKRSSSGEGKGKGKSRAMHSGVKQAGILTGQPRGDAVPSTLPRPLNRITHLNRYRGRRKKSPPGATSTLKVVAVAEPTSTRMPRIDVRMVARPARRLVLSDLKDKDRAKPVEPVLFDQNQTGDSPTRCLAARGAFGSHNGSVIRIKVVDRSSHLASIVQGRHGGNKVTIVLRLLACWGTAQIFCKGTRSGAACSREESNLHGFPHTVLSRTRLPFRHVSVVPRGL